MKKRVLVLVCLIIGFIGFGVEGQAATSGLPINSITGSIYHDINENGQKDYSKLEIGIGKQTISLFDSLENAMNKVQSNGIGTYLFTKLKRGTYYLRYDAVNNYQPVAFEKNPKNNQGTPVSGIVEMEIGNQLNKIHLQNLPLKRVTNLEITPFDDLNWNGTFDSNETVSNGKTMIILDLIKFSEVMETGELANIDVNKLLLSSLSGEVDIADAIFLRTTKNGQIINMPNVKSGLYVILRSPFNLTLSNMLSNITKVNAILEIIQGGDITALLENPDLIATI